jgi:hypothetical protein
VERYPDATGWCKEWGLQNMLTWWQQMRLAQISVFDKETEAARQSRFLHAESGALASSLHRVDDGLAVAAHAVQADPDGPEATAVYEITVPVSGVYKLCCRWLAQPNQSFAVALDDGPVMQQPVPGGPSYTACVFGQVLLLEAGKHRLAVTWPGAGSRLDLLELNLQ